LPCGPEKNFLIEEGVELMLNRITIFLVAIIVSLHVHAGEQRSHEGEHIPPASLQHLSAGLRQLLVEEMVALQHGMEALVPAIISGKWDEIAELGEKMRNSYILKQKLTQSQADELHQSLPLSFREMDQEFHHDAAMLAHAADKKNPELVTFYFYRMTDTCLACHRKFATHRFPGLKSGGVDEGHHH
jgi:hypothetical protein